MDATKLPKRALCPSCGNPMEPGFVIAPKEGAFRQVRWSGDKDPIWPYAGERIPMGNFVESNLNVLALRCPACRLVVLSY